MKIATRALLVLVLLAALVLPFLLKGPDGRRIMTLGDWLPDIGTSQKQPTMSPAGESPAATSYEAAALPDLGRGQMYKWQDSQGRWHFSNEKPDAAAAVTIEDLPEVENVMEPPVKEQDNSSSISLPGGLSL